MAEYSIILNLTGNAVERTEKLAAALGLAAANATTLAQALRTVGSASATIPNRTIRVNADRRSAGRGSYVGTGRSDPAFREYIASLTRRSDALRSMSAYYRELERESTTQYRRHRSTRIFSYGTGFRMGGFSGRFSTILQPDANGRILGIDAESFMSRANALGIATGIVTSIGKAIVKAMAKVTIGQYATGAIGMFAMNRILMSEGMAEGVRIIQRRNQARLGMGDEFLRAQESADLLAQNYGLERSVALSTINVLTGLRVGTKGRTLNVSDATALTRVGGLVAQQSGAPFERVMTNFQQILAQDSPNLRDIRELLNQAPILKRYALDEIAKRGEQIDANSWLKDKANFMDVLTRYDLENSSSLIMQARGMVSVATQDMWAKLAENPEWMKVASYSAELIRSIGDALSGLITSLSNDTGFRNSVSSLIELISYLTDNTDTITSTVSRLTTVVADFLGIDIGNSKERGREVDQGRRTVEQAVDKKQQEVFEMWQKSGLPRSTDPAIQKLEFESTFSLWKSNWAFDREKLGKVTTYGPLVNDTSLLPEYDVIAPGVRVPKPGARAKNMALGTSIPSSFKNDGFTVFGNYKTAHPQDAFAASRLDPNYVLVWAQEEIERAKKNASKIPDLRGDVGTGTDDGSSMSGFNRGMRSLTINFNDAIVKWDSQIVSDDPTQVVAEVRESIEQLTSQAIQKALLGATGKMSTGYF